jgi:transaldolase
VGGGRDDLEARGRWIRSLGDDVVVKVPVTEAGLVATARLAADGIPVLATAVYTSSQVLPVIASGATFVAPYLGRMDDAGRDGHGEIATMQAIIDACGAELRVLVASLRRVADVVALAELGVTDFTLSPALWAGLAADPLTTAAVEVFEAASAGG